MPDRQGYGGTKRGWRGVGIVGRRGGWARTLAPFSAVLAVAVAITVAHQVRV